MPYSNPETNNFVLCNTRNLNIRRALDLGPGSGTYANLLLPSIPKLKLDAVEVWEPYIHEFRLPTLYRQVAHADVRNHDNFDYDLVIFGDILEHMTKFEAKKIWDKVSTQASFAIICIPVIHYPQGASENPYEAHIKDDWTHEEVLDSFSHITQYFLGTETGAYLAEF